MKISGAGFIFVTLSMAWGCARSPEASAPAPVSAHSEVRDGAAAESAPESEPAPTAASPAPAAAPRLDGLLEKKSVGPNDEFQTLEAAEQALNRAKADLDRVALAPAPEVPRARSAGRAADKKGDDQPAPPSGGAAASKAAPNATCENTCRAFTSLTRAANAVCRLDGNGGAHCTRAKRVVAESQARVQRCSCSPNED